MRLKLLVISHNATRTGAPILLLSFLKSYKEANPECEIDLLFCGDGSLLDAFSPIGKQFVYRYRNLSSLNLAIRAYVKFKRFFSGSAQYTRPSWQLRRFVKKDYDLVISNTVTNGAILKKLSPFRCNVVSYVHELENSILAFTTKEDFQRTLAVSSHFWVVSKAVAENLKMRHSVPPSKMSHLPSYIPQFFYSEAERVSLRAALGVKDEIVVGGMGTSDWRKGIDIFVNAAFLLKKRFPFASIKFLWVGANDRDVLTKLHYDLELSGLAESVQILGVVDRPLEYLSCLDIFLLTSREDPYPLVVLEAAMLGKPIICFDKAGGAAEFLSGGAGVVLPYLDIEGLVDQIVSLSTDPQRRDSFGQRAFEKYQSLHSKSIAIPAFEKRIQDLVKKQS